MLIRTNTKLQIYLTKTEALFSICCTFQIILMTQSIQVPFNQKISREFCKESVLLKKYYHIFNVLTQA